MKPEVTTGITAFLDSAQLLAPLRGAILREG